MILFFCLKDKSSLQYILHNTRDGSEFMFLTLCTICNFRGRTWVWVGWGGGGGGGARGGIPGATNLSIMKPAAAPLQR